MTMVSSYFARVGIDVDKADFARVDKYLDSLQRRMLKFQNATGKLTVDVKPNVNVIAAAKTIQRQVTLAMKDVVVPLRKFQIDGKALASQISGTLATKGGASRIRLNATLSQQSLQTMRQQVQNALNGMIISPRVRPVVSPTRGSGASVTPKQGVSSSGGGSHRSGLYDASNGTLARLSRFGLGAIPFIAGAYGLSALNTATQQVTLSDMASKGIFTEATMPNGTTRNVYQSSNNWIRKHADVTGTNLQDVLPAYQGFMAASMPTMGYEPSQGIFKAFSQFGTVRGASKDSMQRALVAVQQMAGKGQVMSEELKGQLAEAQGFGELPQIFAAAYQKKTGGKLVGSAAYVALQDAMKKGTVKSDILLDVATILRQKSDPYIAAASKTSSAEQNRADNARFEFTSKFAAAGGDSGWANIWRTVASMTERATQNAGNLGRYFEIASLYASDILLTFEELGTWLTGNGVGDNTFLNMFGPETNKNIQDIVKGVGDFTTAISNISGSDAALASTKQQLEDITNIIKTAVLSAVQLVQLISGDWKGAVATGLERNKAGLAVLGIKSDEEQAGPPRTAMYSGRMAIPPSIPFINPVSFGNIPDQTGVLPFSGFKDSEKQVSPIIPSWASMYPGIMSAPAPTPFINTPTPLANTPNQAVNNNTTSNSNIININNPVINANPDQTVSQVLADMTANNISNQLYTIDRRNALARSPNGPQ